MRLPTDVIRKIYQYAEPNLSLVGWMSFVGFPIYFLVWEVIYPQPYENLWLRGVCSLSMLVLALREKLPSRLKRYLPIYYVVTIALCLPYFFSFMLLMNGWSTVWAMSFMASIFLHILLVHDTKVVVFQVVASVACAYLTAGLMTDWQITQDGQLVQSYVPIFLFTYIFGNLFYFRNQVEHEFKVSIAKSFGAGIAHEMRNPLSALKSSVDLIATYLPIDSGKTGSVVNISSKDLQNIEEVLSGADEIIRQGNEAIDLLLTSIDQSRVSRSTFALNSAQEVVEQSLQSFAYRSDSAKQCVELQVASDFKFFGSDILLKYALYNLLKNALYYQTEENFRVKVTVSEGEGLNYIYFEDNGVGIEESTLEHIFEDFYTSGKSSSYGLGLPFCLRVMKAFNGSIECTSELGRWTHFTLAFPKSDSIEVEDIKKDVLSSKTALYIGPQDKARESLRRTASAYDIEFESESFTQACKREEFEFEFDLIVIDLDGGLEEDYLTLESKLHFTEARIVLLYSLNSEYPDRFSQCLTLYPIDKNKLTQGFPLLDEIFFSSPRISRTEIPLAKDRSDKQILIADDNDSMRSFTALLLAKQGYKVFQASDGKEAIELLSTENIDLILMDLEMPRVDGIKATVSIRNSVESFSKVPIIGHTGDNQQSTLQCLKNAGMNDYLIKPADKTQLLDKISMYL